MTDIPYSQELLALIARIEAEAYARGKADGKREFLAAVARVSEAPGEIDNLATGSIEMDASGRPASERERAPKGTVRKLIDRVLGDYGGAKPQEILDLADNEYERMVKVASVRSELRNGRKQGRYREEYGKWFLVRDDEKNGSGGLQVGSSPPPGTTSAERG